MVTKYPVSLKKIVIKHNLEPLHLSKDYESAVITTADINRPALQLAGFYNYFDPKRIQVIGRVESTYLETLTYAERLSAFEAFFKTGIAALVLCHGVVPFPSCLEMAEKYDVNLFITSDDTSEFQANLVGFQIYGEGVLLEGDSGIGKSETALELIKRGHRLIADDAVVIKRVNKNDLLGEAPELIRYYMELRGIGVINVRYLYGVSAVKPETNIDMVIKMEKWVDGKAYDRLGISSETENILGVELPCVTIPVEAGRNLAVILELAAMNNRQKKLGYNAAEALESEHDLAVDSGLL